MQAQIARFTATFGQWAQAHTDVIEFLTADDLDLEGSTFLADMAVRVRFGRTLTEAQVDRVRDNMLRRTIRARQQQTAAPRAGDCPAPEGRHTVEGVITEVTAEPGFHSAITHKMTLDVLSDAGTFRVYCTVPAPLITTVGDPQSLTGRRARISIALTRSTTNPAYALGSSPRRAALIGEGTQPGALTRRRTA